jgi:hypothetical protein
MDTVDNKSNSKNAIAPVSYVKCNSSNTKILDYIGDLSLRLLSGELGNFLEVREAH